MLAAYYHTWRLEPDGASPGLTADLVNRATTLPDGSKMILGARSQVNLSFDGPQRQLNLSLGEAYFKVKYDKARPFVVHVGDVSATALGTAFDVRRLNDKVVITVEEGVVEVSSPSAPTRSTSGQQARWRAEAGDQVIYSNSERSATVIRINTSAELAWRNGELAYVREPLSSVVEDLNRYATRKVVLEDAKVAQIRFTGTTFAASPEDWATGLTQIYPIEVHKTPSGEIHLHSRP